MKLESFTATTSSEGVRLLWKTGGEERNLGFNVYREDNGNRVRLNPSLIAGSALRIRNGLEQHAATTYGWIDRFTGAGGHFYWLEDVDLQGTRTLHGPVTPTSDVAVPNTERSQLITELNRPTTDQSLAFLSRSPRARVARPSNDGAKRREAQFKLAAHPAVKMLVRREGWYRVTQAELVAAGLDSSVDPKFLALYAEGREQSVRISGATDGQGRLRPRKLARILRHRGRYTLL